MVGPDRFRRHACNFHLSRRSERSRVVASAVAAAAAAAAAAAVAAAAAGRVHCGMTRRRASSTGRHSSESRAGSGVCRCRRRGRSTRRGAGAAAGPPGALLQGLGDPLHPLLEVRDQPLERQVPKAGIDALARPRAALAVRFRRRRRRIYERGSWRHIPLMNLMLCVTGNLQRGTK